VRIARFSSIKKKFPRLLLKKGMKNEIKRPRGFRSIMNAHGPVTPDQRLSAPALG
jgi:hypothetical protein